MDGALRPPPNPSSDRHHVAKTTLLRQIFSVIGVASLASCAARTVGDGDSSDGADSQGSSESGTSSSESGSGSESGSSDDGLLLDFGGPMTTGDPTTGDPTDPPDTDGGDLCGPFTDYGEVDETPPQECQPPRDWGYDFVCFFPLAGVACEDEPQSYACILEAYTCGLISGGDSVYCGPYTTPEGACCYVVAGGCAVGRPFCVEGRARVAALQPGAGWAEAPQPDIRGLDPHTRAALAEAWGRSGQSEHASIASFARFCSQLLALGAPPRLVTASLAASNDERRHALRCFGLADAYADAARRPAALEVAGSVTPSDPVAIAVSLASEACVAESVSLMLLIAAHHDARDPAVCACLAEMIADERGHVLLAWEALAWMCRQFGDELRAAVMAVFVEAELHVGFGATVAGPHDPQLMREHGYTPIPERRAVAVAVLREVVLPSARALLGDATAGSRGPGVPAPRRPPGVEHRSA